jgi:DUF4097 and DUF4098 domain-containing protein YvlB
MNGRLIIGLGCACLPVLCAHAQPLNRSVEAPAAGEVVISLAVGDVTVRGWDRAVVEVAGQLGEDARELELTQSGEQTTVRVIPEPEESQRTGQAETELFVNVPLDSRITVNGTNTDILIAGVMGAQSLHTVSGDIETETWASNLEAETVGGDVRVSGRGEVEEATLTTVAGEIEVTGAFRLLEASTVSGDIELDILDAAQMILNTTNGDIEVHATLDGQAQLAAETINGDIDLEVGEEGNLNLDISTFSGRIENCFAERSSGATVPGGDVAAETDTRRGRGDRRPGGGELQVTADADSPTVRARSLNGDIEICSS